MEPGSRRNRSAGVSIEIARERVVQALCAHFAQDRLTTEELDSRLARAQQAGSEPQLAALVMDLPALHDIPLPPSVAPQLLAPPPPVPQRMSPTSAPAGWTRDVYPIVSDDIHREEHQRYTAIMFGVNKKGAWVPARHIEIIAMMGGVALDFREAILPAVVTIDVTCIMGGIEIVVPPGVRLEVDGGGIMGAFEESGYGGVPIGPDAPVIHVSGWAVMGGVDAAIRYPGESVRDAKRREKEDRKFLRP